MAGGKEVFRLVGTIELTGLIKVYNDLKGLDDAAVAAAKNLQKLANQFGQIGTTIFKNISVPLAAVGAAAIKAGTDFETAFAGVRKTVDATDEEFNALSDGIRGMSKEMPQSASAIAGVAEAAGQLGIKTENILDFTKTMIMLGDATNLSSTDAATALARFANIVGMSQDKFGQLGSAIVSLGNNFATTEAEIVSMGMRLAGAGAQIGLSEADIMGVATAMSSMGIAAEAGGSAFSKVMVQMQLAVETANEDLEKFASVAGMSAAQFQTAFGQDAIGAIQSFLKGLNNVEQNGMSAIAVLEDMGITETRMRDALLRGAGAADMFGEAVRLSNDAWAEGGALQREAEQRYATTAAQLEILKNRVVDIGVELSETLLPIFRDTLLPALSTAADMIGALAAVFTSLPQPLQTTVVAVLAFAAALGVAFLAISRLILAKKNAIVTLGALKAAYITAAKGTTLLAGAFTKLTAVMIANPIIAVTAAFAGLVAIMWKTHEINQKLIADAAQLQADETRTKALYAEARAAQTAAREYAQLRGTAEFNEDKMRELSKAHEDATIALKNHSLAMQGKTEMTEADTEATRRNVQAQHGIVAAARQTEFELAQAARAEEERRRRREAAAQQAIAAERKRREDLHALITDYEDKLDDLLIENEDDRLIKQGEAEYRRAQALGASEAQLFTIREYWQARLDKLYEDAHIARMEEGERIEQSSAERLRRQGASELELLEMNYREEIAAAEKIEADTSAIEAYYAQERANIEQEAINRRTEANAQWEGRLLQQLEQRFASEKDGHEAAAAVRLSILESEYASALAEAHEHGADTLMVENYYAAERAKIEQQLADELKAIRDKDLADRQAATRAAVDFAMNSINKIGSLFSQAARNEETRLSREYQQRREYIEANVVDEEERAARLEELAQEEDAKKLELQREQARRDKGLGIFNTIVDTARAIVKTLADMGPIAGPIMAGIIGALGAAQTAVIASTPEPFFAGGLITGSPQGITAQVGERNQDELIMPLDVGINKLAAALSERQGVTNNNTASTVVHVHVGTMIADDRGIKQLGRKIREVIINEDRRTGAA